MKTFLAQNQFIPNSTAIRPRAVESAVASKPPPVADATAAPFHSSCGGSRPTAVSPCLRDTMEQQPSSSVASGQSVDPTDPQDSVSPGELPVLYHRDGENEPSVTPAYPPGENRYPLSSNERRSQEASAPAPPKNPDADALGTDFIHEIFFYARKLMKEPPRFVLDEAAFMADVEEIPLFIRSDGYLRRQA